MKIFGINFSKQADNKFHSGIIKDYSCFVQYCVEKRRNNFALVRESKEFSHDVWEESFMVVDVRYDTIHKAKSEQEANKKFAELVRYGEPYDKRVICEATIAELVASRN